ncbi:MAG: porin [Telluria sp.]
MQRKFLAAALFVSLPLVAAAQSNVTIYGIADAAVAHEDTDVLGGSRTVVNSGNQSSSRLGFRGTEDLGNGLKAMFNIEAGYNIDTGMGDSALFGRRSVVGLEGGFGLVTIGREYSPIASVAGQSDILGQGFYGTNLSSFNSGRLTRRISNSVNYKSSAMSGFKVLAAYGLGETTTGPSGDLMGVALEYANGPLFVGAGYHQLERLASGDDKEYTVGAGYKFGVVEVKGNYMVADQTGANNKYEQLNLGAAVGVGSAGKVYINLQRNERAAARGNLVALAYSYALSKRTNVYATAAKMSNNSAGTFGINASGVNITPPATGLGADPSGYAVGVRHTF